MSVGDATLGAIAAARRAEREQAAFYRALASEASLGGDAGLEERLNELHADEQHQLSQLTARLLELGVQPEPLRGPALELSLDGWMAEARRREHEEIDRYERLLEEPLDDDTRRMIAEFLRVEKLHAENLGGKWMGA